MRTCSGATDESEAGGASSPGSSPETSSTRRTASSPFEATSHSIPKDCRTLHATFWLMRLSSTSSTRSPLSLCPEGEMQKGRRRR